MKWSNEKQPVIPVIPVVITPHRIWDRLFHLFQPQIIIKITVKKYNLTVILIIPTHHPHKTHYRRDLTLIHPQRE